MAEIRPDGRCRPVVSERIAETSASGRSSAAGSRQEPAEGDDPDLGLALVIMKVTAASSAASIRVGAMSVEHMLPETSIVRITVVWFVGTLSTTEGRASATISRATAEASMANGRWRRNRARPGNASRTRARLE
jgi:hypothetical protein